MTRSRIIGKSREIVRKEIYDAVTKGLRETNIVDRLYVDTERLIYISGAKLPRTIDLITDQDILDVVLKHLPKSKWDKHLHKEIAKETGLSNNMVSKAISTLLGTGKVVKP